MTIQQHEDLILHDHEPGTDSFRDDILEGLRQSPKRISSKFFYDERGSKLFEEITQLDEYYLTRTEISILREHLPEMAKLIGPEALVIEFGTGAGIKTHLLLEALDHPAAYVPIDISREQLIDASLELLEAFLDLEVWPVCADYTNDLSLPTPTRATKQTVVFFPGSTIGNFTPEEAIVFLKNVAGIIGTTGSLLIGYDRRKDASILNAAYNDKRGVTAEFNLNLITRIDKEFDANIPAENFTHYAAFNEEQSRIEMHLVSRDESTLALANESIHLDAGEHIITEYSYKYSREAFDNIIAQAGMRTTARWTDADEYFEIAYCRLA